MNEFLKALDDYKDQLVPINRNSALVNDLRKALSSPPQLNSPEMPDYKSALLGLLTNRISKDHLGFFTLAEINKTNLARAVEVSEATINFENVPQVKIGECLIPNGWLITQDWIKCSDHKPDSSGEFLVYETLNNRVQHDYWVPDDCAALGLGFWNHYANYVTHWMPLPTAPEKENG
ncbi:TPA: DUF551 domain-containing protein [Yersinia enterocolitica]|nr:DUF551 domain-containing protein [Yersinia enterocolitica]